MMCPNTYLYENIVGLFVSIIFVNKKKLDWHLLSFNNAPTNIMDIAEYQKGQTKML